MPTLIAVTLNRTERSRLAALGVELFLFESKPSLAYFPYLIESFGPEPLFNTG